jgi:uncharacterized protein with FMN-binding domain
MRRRAAAVMSALSIAVIGFSVRASEHAASSTTVAAAGIVDQSASQPTQSTPTASASPKPSTSPTPRRTASATPTPTSKTTAPKTTAPKTTPSAQPTQSAAPKTVTVNGAAVDTNYGPVQVQISLRGSQIISATAIVYPQESRRDLEINSYAIPMLQQDTVTKQSAQVDTVSGATYTSDGYRQSLQSALDAAHQAGAR